MHIQWLPVNLFLGQFVSNVWSETFVALSKKKSDNFYRFVLLALHIPSWMQLLLSILQLTEGQPDNEFVEHVACQRAKIIPCGDLSWWMWLHLFSNIIFLPLFWVVAARVGVQGSSPFVQQKPQKTDETEVVFAKQKRSISVARPKKYKRIKGTN